MSVVTIKDIAKKLGISAATVSLALNNRHGVNEQTKQKVMELVQELNYNGVASKRKSAKSNKLISFVVYKRYGKVVGDTQFFTELIEAVENAARALDYGISLTYCNGEDNLSEALQQAMATKPEGIIILGTEMVDENVRVLEKIKIPIVVLDNDLLKNSIDTVTIHNQEGICQAVNRLYELGHKKIGYIKSSFAINNFKCRFFGYRYALEGLGLAFDPRYVFSVDPSIDGSYHDFSEQLKEPSLELPTAFLADNDLIALGAIKALKNFGVKMPEDVSIIGFDDLSLCTFVDPELSSIKVPIKQLGEVAIKQLIDRILGRVAGGGIQISVGTELINRASLKGRKS